MRRLVGSLLLIAALALAACNPDNIIPDGADWCYLFDFTNNDSMDTTYGRWLPGVGYLTDENNNLGLTYQHSTTVAPIMARVGLQRGSAGGDISVVSNGTIFGISAITSASVPAALPANQIVPYDFAAPNSEYSEAIGSQVNVTVQTNGGLIFSYMEVFGRGDNPFGVSNCPTFIDLTLAPPPTSTNLPTSQPTWTPAATDLPTITPSPTTTPSPTPSHSPTPTFTPTARYYLSPLLRASGNLNCPYECYQRDSVIVQPNAEIVGLVVMDIGSNGANGRQANTDYGIHGVSSNIGNTATPGADLIGVNSSGLTGVPGMAGNSTIATAVATLIGVGANEYAPRIGITPVPVGTRANYSFGFWGNGSAANVYFDYHLVLQGWPTPTPSPSPTPTWSPTPTPTPVVTNPFTLTPAGPTFTPHPRATSAFIPPGPGGNVFRGGLSYCTFGDGNYMWDFRNQSAFQQSWQNPYSDELAATWSQYVGMNLPLVNNVRQGRFWLSPLTQAPGAIVEEVQVFSPSSNSSWNVSAGFAPSRNPAYQAAATGSGWNSSGTLNTTNPSGLFVSVRSNNAELLTVSFIVMKVSNCPGTPTPSATFQVVPPINTPVILPTVYNWMTPSGTYQVIGTPQGTPGGTGTPDGSSTPGSSPTPYGTPAPDGGGTPVAGEYGDIGELGGNILGVGGNLFGLGRSWLSEMSTRVTGIIGAWNTAPVTAPPGVPLCTSQPTSNQFCAILYIIRYTILSGPIGTLIMPLATVVFDLFIVFLFIRMLRAILARLGKVTEV